MCHSVEGRENADSRTAHQARNADMCGRHCAALSVHPCIVSAWMNPEDLKKASRPIHGHGGEPVAPTLRRIADWCEDRNVEFDAYGSGDLVQQFESDVAALLGFPAASFMPSGTLAQQVALRIWAEESGINHVAMHPTAHLELHEERGYAHLHHLMATLVGPRESPMLAEHLSEAPEPLAAVLVELPTREAGGVLPTWAELEEIKKEAKDRNIRLHLDGARLWECGPAYGKPYAEICEGFDSAYVSFYKGIGALPGSMLLGPEEFVAQAKVWQRRGGGNLCTVTPNVASAAMQLSERLDRMPALLDRARSLATSLASIDGISIKPSPPHINMFHLYLEMDARRAIDARNRVAEEHQLWAFSWVQPASVPDTCWTEVYVGEAAMSIANDDIEAAFKALITHA